MTVLRVPEKKPLYRIVKPNQDKAFEARMHQDPEKKAYLVGITYTDDDLFTRQAFQFCDGRTEAYKFIVSFFDELYEVNANESFVLVEGLTLHDAVTVYAFMKHVQKFYNDGFDIDDYYTPPSEDESDNVNPSLMPPLPIFSEVQNGITIEEFMNGGRYFNSDLPPLKEDDINGNQQ